MHKHPLESMLADPHGADAGLTRRRLITAAAAGLTAAAFPGARAEDRYPSRPITLWVPWPAGGATDITLRVLVELASHKLGVKIVTENRGGAGGTMAMPVLQQAPPDGYTIAQIPQTVFRAPWIRKVSWDPIRDITPIIQVSGVTFGVLVPADSAMKTFDDLFAFAKAHPRTLTIATNGVGTTPHVVLDEIFAKKGLTYVHVPYKGTSEQMVAVSSGQVMVGVNSNGYVPFVESGRLRLLVTFGENRTKRWPDVPTLKDLGYGIVATSPYGIGGPHGMPPQIVQVLHDAFKSAMYEPSHIAQLAQYDQELDYLGPEEYGKAMRDVYAKERATVERMGLARTTTE